MFLSVSSANSNVEDEALLPFIRQRSLIRFAIVLGMLALSACLSFAMEPVKKKRVVRSTTPAKRAASAKAGVKAPLKSAAVPHVVAKAGVKHIAPATQAAATNQAIVARMNAGKRMPPRSAWKAPNYADSLEGDNV